MKQTIKKLFHKLGIDLISYSSSDLYRINQLLKSRQINLVLDVGANIGQYKKRLRTYGYSGRIVSFEPLSHAHSQLVKLSQSDPNWEIAPRMAIGDQKGEVVMNVAGNSQSSSVLPMLEVHKDAAPESIYVRSETVLLDKLDNVLPQYLDNSDAAKIFLKIDVQGYEKNVLDGARNSLNYIQGIQLEMSLVSLYEGEILFQEMLEYLIGLGYSLNYLLPGFADRSTGRMLQVDGVFFK